MKKPEIYLTEYCQKLSNDMLDFLIMRLEQRVAGDLSDACDFLGSVKEIDRWLVTAESNDEFYDMLDLIQTIAKREVSKREAA